MAWIEFVAGATRRPIKALDCSKQRTAQILYREFDKGRAELRGRIIIWQHY